MDMFAVIRTGGKQYKVARDDVIVVEKLTGDEGSPLELTDVLAIGDGKDTTFGTPVVQGASVTATVLEQTRGDKIIVFKKKRRHNYRRKKGHRQALTVLRITDILLGGRKKAAAKAEPKAKAAAKAMAAAKPKAKAEPKAKAAAKPKAKAEPKAKAAKKKAAPAARAKTAARAQPAKKKAAPKATKKPEEKK